MCTVLLEDFSYCLEFHDRNIFLSFLDIKSRKLSILILYSHLQAKNTVVIPKRNSTSINFPSFSSSAWVQELSSESLGHKKP